MVNSVHAVFLEPHTGIRTFTLNYCIGYVVMAKLASPSVDLGQKPGVADICSQTEFLLRNETTATFHHILHTYFFVSYMTSQISTSSSMESGDKGLNPQLNSHTHRNYFTCCSCELPTPFVLYGCTRRVTMFSRLCATAPPLAALNCL